LHETLRWISSSDRRIHSRPAIARRISNQNARHAVLNQVIMHGEAQARFRVGVDVGGTFTDVVLVEEQSGQILVAKVHTVPADPSQGCIAGIDKVLKEFGLDAGQISVVVHGTTIATNTIIEGKGAKAGLVTSEGFR